MKQNLCVRCLDESDVETESCFKDARGQHACARHAHEDGTHVKQKLCVKCLMETDTETHSRHARQDGTHVKLKQNLCAKCFKSNIHQTCTVYLQFSVECVFYIYSLRLVLFVCKQNGHYIHLTISYHKLIPTLINNNIE